jgi:hypothetical protein
LSRPHAFDTWLAASLVPFFMLITEVPANKGSVTIWKVAMVYLFWIICGYQHLSPHLSLHKRHFGPGHAGKHETYDLIDAQKGVWPLSSFCHILVSGIRISFPFPFAFGSFSLEESDIERQIKFSLLRIKYSRM